MDIQRQAFQEWYIANHHDGDIHPNQQLLEWSEKGGFYFASSVEDLWEAWQAAKSKAVPDGYCVVPKEPTPKMSIAYQKNAIAPVSSLSISGYKAMIEAQEPSND